MHKGKHRDEVGKLSGAVPCTFLSSCYYLWGFMHIYPVSSWVSSVFSGFLPLPKSILDVVDFPSVCRSVWMCTCICTTVQSENHVEKQDDAQNRTLEKEKWDLRNFVRGTVVGARPADLNHFDLLWFFQNDAKNTTTTTTKKNPHPLSKQRRMDILLTRSSWEEGYASQNTHALQTLWAEKLRTRKQRLQWVQAH